MWRWIKSEQKKIETSILSEEMEKLLSRTSDDLMQTLVNLSGSLTDIACGTHIKIPTDAGFVSYYKSADNFSTLTLNLREKIQETDEDLIISKS